MHHFEVMRDRPTLWLTMSLVIRRGVDFLPNLVGSTPIPPSPPFPYLPSRPLASLPLLSSSVMASLISPLTPHQIQLEGLGSAVGFPSWVWGGAPAANAFALYVFYAGKLLLSDGDDFPSW